MIVITTPFPRAWGLDAITVWPFIFIRRKEEVYAYDGLLVHERVHGERQRKSFLLAWWFWYLLSWQFRYEEELLAYVVQIRHAREVGYGMNVVTAAGLLANYYNLPYDRVRIMADLNARLA